MNPLRKHDKQVFYKYMPANTAKIVLANKTLRWSSPTEFNDPFDVPRVLAHDLKPSDIKQAIVENHLRIVRDKNFKVEHFPKKVQAVASVVRNTSHDVKKEIEEMLYRESESLMSDSRRVNRIN